MQELGRPYMKFRSAIHFGRHFEIEDLEHQNFHLCTYLKKLYDCLKTLTWKESVQ